MNGRPGPHRPTLAVCVVTYERPTYLRRCVASLVDQGSDVDEIVVVDASRRSDGAALARLSPAVRYVHAPQLAGWMTRSRNEALRWVDSDLIAFVDDDVVVADGWGTALREAFAAGADAVVGRTRNGIPGEEHYDRPIGRLLPDGRLTEGFAAQTGGCVRVDHGIGANMAFRRDLLGRLGGFRDDYPGTALREDTDVFLRVRKLGRAAVFAPDATVDHRPAPHVKGARFDTRYKLYGRRNHVVLLAREGGAGGRLLWHWVAGELRGALRAEGHRYRALKTGVVVLGIGWGLLVLPRYAAWGPTPAERVDDEGREIRRLLTGSDDLPRDGAAPPAAAAPRRPSVPAGRVRPRLESVVRTAVASATRRLPARFRGRQRLLRMLDERVPRGRPMVVAPMRLGYRMRVDLRSRTEVFAYYTGRYDTALIRAARCLLPPGGVAVDVGANVGFWAVPLAQKGRVYAFEPVPSNAVRIHDNALLNGLAGSLRVREVALSDTPGQVDLTLREDFQRGAATGNAAVVIDASDSAFDIITAAADTLDNQATELAWDRLDVLKLDIEGHEDLALTGARRTLEEFRPVIFLEWNEDYYRRRGVDPAERFATALRGLDYTCLREAAAGWQVVPSFSSPAGLDDLVFAPAERAAEVLAALSLSED